MDLPLILLAAGRSTRFGTLKQVAPVGPGGASILAYSVADTLLAGFSEVVLVVRPEIEDTIRDHLDEHLGVGLPIRYVHQEQALGTAHAALVGLAGVDGPGAIANGDDAYGRDALATLRRSADNLRETEVALVAYPIAGTLSPHGGVSRGWVRADGEKVTAIHEMLDVRDSEDGLVGRTVAGEEHAMPRDALGSMNLWMLGPGLRPLLSREFERHDGTHEFLLSEVLGRLVEAGEVAIRLAGTATGWFGLTFADDLAAARARMADLHRLGRYAGTLAETVAPFRHRAG